MPLESFLFLPYPLLGSGCGGLKTYQIWEVSRRKNHILTKGYQIVGNLSLIIAEYMGHKRYALLHFERLQRAYAARERNASPHLQRSSGPSHDIVVCPSVE